MFAEGRVGNCWTRKGCGAGREPFRACEVVFQVHPQWPSGAPHGGFKYSYHSLRHMAASSMKAIGVSDQKVKMMGRWKCIETVDDTYVDPACAATYGCYRLYGHLLPPLNRLEHLARRPEELRRWSCAGG